MSTVPTPPVVAVTITAHHSLWGYIAKILAAINAANPIIATIIPAPVEAGIVIGTTLAPVVVGTIQAAQTPE